VLLGSWPASASGWPRNSLHPPLSLQPRPAEYSVLAANAYNAWALVGPQQLVRAIGTGASSWTTDSLPVLGGTPAVLVGGVLLGLVGFLVVTGLLLRDDKLSIVLGFTLLAFAFYAIPTRVHERYLFPVFASGAILASGAFLPAAGYIVVGVLNTANLHAVLAAPLGFGVGIQQGPGFPRPGPLRSSGPPGFRPGVSAIMQIHLPLAALARSLPVATCVAVGQTVAVALLLTVWLVVIARPQTE
jgi:hypothetical protein